MSASSSTTTQPGLRFPFRTKLTIAASLLAVVPLVALSVRLLDVADTTVRTMSQEYQNAIADDVARTIDHTLGTAQDGLDAIGRTLTDATIASADAVALARHLVSSNVNLDQASIYDARGALIDTIREEGAVRVAAPARLDDALRAAADRDGLATGGVTPAPDAPHALLVIPLHARGATTGYVASQVSLAPVEARVARLSAVRFEGIPNALFVVDRDLRVIASADPQQARDLPSAKGQGVLAGLDAAALQAGVLKTGEVTGPDGVARVGTVIGLRSYPWAVVVQVPARIAYASLDQMRQIIWVTTALAVVLALLIAFVVARQITRPVRALAELASHLANRRFNQRVEVRSRDELGTLGAVMNSAAADLAASEDRIRTEVAIRGDLRRYLPGELVDKVVAREQDMHLGGTRREVTVLFADVVAFTPLTERLGADEIVSMLNELFTILTEIVFRHGGTIDKFIGDCVMAMWGAPTHQPDHAARGVAAAEDMLRWLEAGNEGWKERYGAKIELAIGISSGTAIVGNIGSETRMEYTAIGDTVNVAARLESIARPQTILVTAATRAAASEGFEYIDRGERSIPGRAQTVQVFEVRT